MTKTQGQFEKRPRDFYPTPLKAVTALVGHLPEGFSFCEPCAGAGDLVRHLEGLFEGCACFLPLDVEPQVDWVTKGDANNLTAEALEYCDVIITNPPFTWSVLKPLLDKWISLKPTILLLPADFMHNIRFAPYMKLCEKMMSIGRVQWIEGSKGSGVENYCWYWFDNAKEVDQSTKFYGRTK
jgi:hypothetical protein